MSRVGMAGQRRTSVHAEDGCRLAVTLWGTGPNVVLVHGGGCDASSWAAVVPRLPTDFGVCVYDRRGRASSGDGRHHSLDREAEDLAAVAAATAPVAALATMDPQALLRRARDPRVLVVRGGRTDHPVYPTAADLASCRTATLPGHGHLSALPDPAALLAVVERELAGSLPEGAR